MTTPELEKEMIKFIQNILPEDYPPPISFTYRAGASKGVELFIRDRLPDLVREARTREFQHDLFEQLIEEAKKDG